ncbi:hypothetical protein IW147_006348, partial [Coemansia sp. RSA 720]
RSAVCEAGDVGTKIVSSPKQGDVKKCLSEKDDNGVVGKPSGSGSGSKDDDSSDDSGSDEDSDTSSGAATVTARLSVAVAAVLLLAF